MTQNPLSLSVMPLRLPASVSLLLTALVSHIIFYARGFVIHWCIEVLWKQGTLPFIAQFRGDPVMIDEPKENLLAAATILSTESRHSAWLDSALRQGSAWSGPFDVMSEFSDTIKS